MVKNLTCFKCYKETATLTYEESRIYKVSCPCGCEYSFEHSSMKCAEEYHYKMLELYRQVDRADRLRAENAKLRELVGLAVEDIYRYKRCLVCKHCNTETGTCPHDNKTCLDRELWQWQHTAKLNEIDGKDVV